MSGTSVTASIIVQFGDEANANTHVSIEIDSRSEADGGLNKGKTSFKPGDTVYLLVHKSVNVTLTDHTSSAGVLTKLPGQIYVKNEDNEEVSFSDSDEASASKPVYNDFEYTWMGSNHDLGSILPSTGYPNLKANSKTLYEVGIASISYDSLVTIYRLETPSDINGETDYRILCVVYAQAN